MDRTLPGEMQFDAMTRRRQGTAAAATYTLQATDVNGSTATQTFLVTVEGNPLTFGGATVEPVRHLQNREINPQR